MTPYCRPQFHLALNETYPPVVSRAVVELGDDLLISILGLGP